MYFNEKKQELAPFVNLRSDVGFKAVFADKNNKDILIGVLNQILPPEAARCTLWEKDSAGSGLP